MIDACYARSACSKGYPRRVPDPVGGEGQGQGPGGRCLAPRWGGRSRRGRPPHRHPAATPLPQRAPRPAGSSRAARAARQPRSEGRPTPTQARSRQSRVPTVEDDGGHGHMSCPWPPDTSRLTTAGGPGPGSSVGGPAGGATRRATNRGSSLTRCSSWVAMRVQNEDERRSTHASVLLRSEPLPGAALSETWFSSALRLRIWRCGSLWFGNRLPTNDLFEPLC
jgi:hypothetical protein